MQLLTSFVAIATIITTNFLAEAQITTIAAFSKRQTEELRGEIVSKIQSESERIDNKDGGKDMILNKESIYARQREFKINVKISPNVHQCHYEPLLQESSSRIYKYKRELNYNEGEVYKKYGSLAFLFIKGIEEGDGIIQETTTWTYGGRVTSSSVSYKLVSKIKNVAFSCPLDTFCCGLFCCPRSIQSFFDSQRSSIRTVTPKKITSTDNFEMSTSPILKANGVANGIVVKQCQLTVDKNDYYSAVNETKSVYYRCPIKEKEQCCSDQLCCDNPKPSTRYDTDYKSNTFSGSSNSVSVDGKTAGGGVFVFFAILYILYRCCCCWCRYVDHDKENYIKGTNV